jgi:outer membrane biosynthesis protein TonB
MRILGIRVAVSALEHIRRTREAHEFTVVEVTLMKPVGLISMVVLLGTVGPTSYAQQPPPPPPQQQQPEDKQHKQEQKPKPEPEKQPEAKPSAVTQIRPYKVT